MNPSVPAAPDNLASGSRTDTWFGADASLLALITGTEGDDSLTGTVDDDTIDGAAGNDTLVGGLGNDTYIVDSALDVITEAFGEGTDTVVSSVSFTLAEAVENLTLAGTAANGTGNSLNNAIVGNTANNRLDGGTGIDTLTGGAGNDTYVVDDAADTVVEGAGDGTDTVRASVSYTLADRIEKLVLTGTADLTGTGNTLNNTLTGNRGANRLEGGDGNDTLDGGVGTDTLVGGAGNDTYTVDAVGDQVLEDAGAGRDTVLSSVALVLASQVENLTLTGAANLNGTGNSSNNQIIGNAGNNALDGAAGSDTLDGGAGADTLTGGFGDDTYIVDQLGDLVVETALSSVDTVQAGLSYSLGAALENLVLTGSDDLSGTGNELNNLLQGNAGNNTLIGDAGNDTLDGGAGADTMTGGVGADTYTVASAGDQVVEAAGEGRDTVVSSITYTLGSNVENLTLTGSANLNGTGNTLDNNLVGNAGVNVLLGLDGDDRATFTRGTFDGGVGDDTGTIRVLGTVDTTSTSWQGNGSMDWTNSRLTVTNVLASSSSLGFNTNDAARQFTLTGVENLNVLAGSNANDLLFVRGTGTDYHAGAGSDTFYADWSTATNAISWVNNPAVTQTVNGVRVSGFERLILSTGSGNDLLNSSAFAFNDDFASGAGDDTLIGGAGDDLYNSGAGNDRIGGNYTGDIYVVGGDGDDTLVQLHRGTFDGGLGIDSTTIDFIGTSASTNTYWRYGQYNTAAEWTSSRSTAASAATSTSLDFYNNNDAGLQFILTNVENLNVLAGSAGNDLLFVRGTGTDYHAGAGSDTFYADWSASTSAISWVNNPAVTQTINGVRVSGFERLILSTGSGSDLLNSSAFAFNDDFASGAGDDTLIGGAGDDLYNSGAGNDRIGGNYTGDIYVVGGDGDDTLVQLHRGTFDGGLGIDSTTIDFIGTSASTNTYWRYGQYNTAAEWTSSRSTAASAATSTSLDFYNNNDAGLQFILTNVENLNVLAGSAGNDLLFVRGTGTDYHAGAGSDTFYADWNTAANAISWVNNPAITQTVNGVRVSGFERLILSTGSGNDLLNSSAFAFNDDFASGAGDDTLIGGAGDDLYNAGAGNDRIGGNYTGDIYVVGGDGDDTLVQLHRGTFDGGLGIDSTTVDFLGTAATTSTSWTYGQYSSTADWTASRNVAAAVATSTTTSLGLNSNDGGRWFTLTSVENLNILAGSVGNDLLFVRGTGTDYHAGAGSDTFYADWSTATNAISWVNNPAVTQTVNGVRVSGFERLILSTGSGNDLLDASAAAFNDDLFTGAGDDTLTGGGGSDFLGGGTGSDVFALNSVVGSDTVYDFVSGTDKIRINQSALAIGDGDQVVEGAVSIASPGGFGTGAELVVVTTNISGTIDATKAAAVIGSASAAYTVGQTVLFAVDNGSQSFLYRFQAADADALVSAAELTLLAQLTATPATGTGDFIFGP